MDVITILTTITILTITVSLTTVLSIVWTMDELSSAINADMCLPNTIGALDCKPSVSVLPGYLNMQISEEYSRIHGREQENLNKYFSDENNKELLEAVYSNDYWEMKPAGRVTGLTLKEPLKNKDKYKMETVRNWKSGNKLQERNGFLRQGVRYNNGRLVVPSSGLYFVYSFVDFKERCKRENGEPDIEDIDIPLKHSIYSFNINKGYETEVVSGHHPHKKSLNRYFNSYSSYISSLTELVAGDEIFIKVSNITNIDFAENNYFGLYLV